ncbi:MAG: glycosyltransferase family 4 protein [Xanthobacteraceae bacterium]|nr:glycosyltransferase family 4 protein [Xanthobacteraceae bacterium]
MTKDVLFIQGRTHKAGAQTCLARLLRHERVRQWNCRALSSQSGWFTEECARIGVPVTLEQFPSSRSLTARLFGNEAFSRCVAAELAGKNFRPAIVFANDHQEGLLALSLAKRFGAKTAILLRSPGMRREDYDKYRCGSFDHVSAIGDELAARVQAWEPSKKVHVAYDGVFGDEFLPPQEKPAQAPSRILAIGSPLAWKGWADLVEALAILEQQGKLPKLQMDFTGAMPAVGDNDLKLSRLENVQCSFLGRVEKFRELVREYDLVINPSRMETFGMAAVEVLAAGVPLLSSRTGVIEDVHTNPAMLFEAANPASLAQALRGVLEGWSGMDFGVTPAQRNIRRKFMIDHAAAALDASFNALVR